MKQPLSAQFHATVGIAIGKCSKHDLRDSQADDTPHRMSHRGYRGGVLITVTHIPTRKPPAQSLFIKAPTVTTRRWYCNLVRRS